MNEQGSGMSRGRTAVAYGAVFVSTLLIARLIDDLARYGILFRKESWLTVSAWIGPIGFVVGLGTPPF